MSECTNNKTDGAVTSPSQPSPSEATAALLRQLLVGDALTRIEQRFEALENRIEKQCDQVMQDLHSTIVMFEQFTHQELRGFAERISAEERSRHAAITSVREEFERGIDHFEGLVQILRSVTLQSHNELREQVHQFSQTVQKGTDKKISRTNLLIEKTREEVKSHRVDRSTLASLLAQVAQQIDAAD